LHVVALSLAAIAHLLRELMIEEAEKATRRGVVGVCRKSPPVKRRIEPLTEWDKEIVWRRRSRI